MTPEKWKKLYRIKEILRLIKDLADVSLERTQYYRKDPKLYETWFSIIKQDLKKVLSELSELNESN